MGLCAAALVLTLVLPGGYEIKGQPGWIYDPVTQRAWSGRWADNEATLLDVDTTVENAMEALKERESDIQLMKQNPEEWSRQLNAKLKDVLNEIDSMTGTPKSLQMTKVEVLGERTPGGGELLPTKLRDAMQISTGAVEGIAVGNVRLTIEEVWFDSGAIEEVGIETVEGAVIGAGEAAYALGMAGLI